VSKAAMPQTFRALRCAFCETFQVHQEAKAPKWTCLLCHEKQSVVRVYCSGPAKEVRNVVQELNMARATMGTSQSDCWTNSDTRDDENLWHQRGGNSWVTGRAEESWRDNGGQGDGSAEGSWRRGNGVCNDHGGRFTERSCSGSDDWTGPGRFMTALPDCNGDGDGQMQKKRGREEAQPPLPRQVHRSSVMAPSFLPACMAVDPWPPRGGGKDRQTRMPYETDSMERVSTGRAFQESGVRATARASCGEDHWYTAAPSEEVEEEVWQE